MWYEELGSTRPTGRRVSCLDRGVNHPTIAHTNLRWISVPRARAWLRMGSCPPSLPISKEERDREHDKGAESTAVDPTTMAQQGHRRYGGDGLGKANLEPVEEPATRFFASTHQQQRCVKERNKEGKAWRNMVNAMGGWTSEDEAALEWAVVSEGEHSMFLHDVWLALRSSCLV